MRAWWTRARATTVVKAVKVTEVATTTTTTRRRRMVESRRGEEEEEDNSAEKGEGEVGAANVDRPLCRTRLRVFVFVLVAKRMTTCCFRQDTWSQRLIQRGCKRRRRRQAMYRRNAAVVAGAGGWWGPLMRCGSTDGGLKDAPAALPAELGRWGATTGPLGSGEGEEDDAAAHLPGGGGSSQVTTSSSSTSESRDTPAARRGRAWSPGRGHGRRVGGVGARDRGADARRRGGLRGGRATRGGDRGALEAPALWRSRADCLSRSQSDTRRRSMRRGAQR